MIIEKNIPVPANVLSSGQGAAKKYPELYEMGVGESVLAEGENASYASCPMYGAAKQIQLRTEKKFCARQENGKVRIWRIA